MDKYSWNTKFEVAQRLMIHIFSNRIKVVTDLKKEIIMVIKDDTVIRSLNYEMTCADYNKLLHSIARDAAILKTFDFIEQ